MLQLLSSHGPLTVGVDASNWVNYQGGVIQFHCGEIPRNHAVQIVGYDLTGKWYEMFGGKNTGIAVVEAQLWV